MELIGVPKNLFAVWMQMIRSVGGEFIPYRDTEPKGCKPKPWKQKLGLVAEVKDIFHERMKASRLAERFSAKYSVGNNGVITRKVPKRDKSISARQWKKRARASRHREVTPCY